AAPPNISLSFTPIEETDCTPNPVPGMRSSDFRCSRARSSSSIPSATILSDMSMTFPNTFFGVAADVPLPQLVQMRAYLLRRDGLVVVPALDLVAASGANHVGLG